MKELIPPMAPNINYSSPVINSIPNIESENFPKDSIKEVYMTKLKKSLKKKIHYTTDICTLFMKIFLFNLAFQLLS